jgi:hypothetical protein
MYKAELYFRVFTHDGHATLFKELRDGLAE